LFRAFEVKAVDDAERTFTGLAGAFSQDQGGDVILPGAFKRTLADWKRSKKVMPLMDSHNYGSVRAVIGKMLSAAETADGLEATFQVIDGPDGDEVFRRIKGGFIDGLSIGYRAIEQRAPTEEQQREGIWRFLKEIALREISVVVWPMNVDARIDTATVKHLLDAAKERALTEDEVSELQSIQEQIKALLPDPVPAGGVSPEGKVDDPPPAAIPDPPVPAAVPGEEVPGEVVPSPVAAPPAPPEMVTLAADDPRRIKMEETLRELTLHALSAH
jgi:hypothetical protein